MSTQPEALRLAETIHCGDDFCNCSRNLAGAELRRLHDLLGKANALAKIRAERVKKMEAVNQELLAALKGALWRMEQYNYQAMEGTIANVRAAIAKAVGETK